MNELFFAADYIKNDVIGNLVAKIVIFAASLKLIFIFLS